METAIVLAGGRSTRMGTDKAGLMFLNEPLLARVIGRLGAERTIVVAAPEQTLPALSGRAVTVVRDEQPGKGPLGGLYTGLRAAESAYCTVVACDMPFTNRRLLDYSLEIAQRGSYEVVLPMVDGQLQFLHGAYSRSLIPALQEALDDDRPALHAFVQNRTLGVLADAELAPFLDEMDFQCNVNTPDEAQEAVARARIASSKPVVLSFWAKRRARSRSISTVLLAPA